MNVSDIELSKKSKIIEIGLEKKKLQPLKVGDISKKSENLRMFVREIQVLLQKLSRKKSGKSKKSEHREKVFLIVWLDF